MLKYLTAKSHSVTANFNYIDWEELASKVQQPPNLGSVTAEQAKSKSAIIAATDAVNKTKESVLLHDQFTLLRLDLDDTKMDLDSIEDALDGMGFTAYIVHSTASHQQGDNGNRYRIYMQLAASLDYVNWAALQSYLSYMFMADDCATRPQQIMYLPVRFKGDEYAFKIAEGEAFTALGSNLMVKAHTFIEQQSERQAKANSKAVVKPSFNEKLIGKQVSVIDAINNSYEWDSLLSSYGYKRQGKAYLPPEATSKAAGAYILTSNTDGRQRYFSHHESDPCATGQCLDLFDFIVIRSHRGNERQALKEIAQTHFKAIDKHNKKEWAISKTNQSAKLMFSKVVEL
jgi:hypothetical protein